MKEKSSEHGAYVRKVQEETQSFTQDILAEVERLRVLAATQEREVRRQQGQLESLLAESTRSRCTSDMTSWVKLCVSSWTLRTYAPCSLRFSFMAYLAPM